MAICRTLIGCVAIHFALVIMAVAGDPTYTYYDLGSLGLPVFNIAHDVNDLGIVAGETMRSHEVFSSAYTWDNGVMTDHTDSIPGGWFGAISGISETGPMSGGASGVERAVLWKDGVGYYPDVPDGCQANEGVLGINAAGTLAVGQCEVEDGYNNMPALYFVDSGSGLALGFLPDTPDDAQGWANGVNDAGIVVGWFDDGRAFWWQDGNMEEIPNLLGATVITARAINNAGLVVGNATNTPNGNVATSYDLNSGIMTDLGFGTPKDVNELGRAVGVSGSHAMLYQNGEVIDLHELSIGHSLDWSTANGINNHGWIVGYGREPDGGDHRGWLLVPGYDKGDFDGDGDVDLQDSGHFQRCFAAPPYIDGTLHVGCSVFDFDDDVDLDLDDYAAFQSAFTGPTAPNLNPNGPG